MNENDFLFNFTPIIYNISCNKVDGLLNCGDDLPVINFIIEELTEVQFE